MGYSEKGSIRSFWPDDTENEFYIPYETDLDTIYTLCEHKWGKLVQFSKITIAPENIHTHCLTYDLHDPNDYTNFLKVSYNP